MLSQGKTPSGVNVISNPDTPGISGVTDVGADSLHFDPGAATNDANLLEDLVTMPSPR